MNQEHNIDNLNEGNTEVLETYNFEGVELPVSFIETTQVTDGVECDVYKFKEDESKDLGIIRVRPGKKTPLQKVLQGEKTIEQFISGKGKLIVSKQDGTPDVLLADDSNPISRVVEVDELMQWEAAPDSDLVAAEICYPPYQEGRFENID